MRKLAVLLVSISISIIAATIVAQESDISGFDLERPYYLSDDGEIDHEALMDWSELIYSYTDEKGQQRNVYTDISREIVWDQLAEKGGGLLETVYKIVPTYLQYWVTGDSNYHVLNDLELIGGCGSNCEYYENTSGDCPSNVTRLKARGATPVDYCDGYYYGQYWTSSSYWYNADDYDCGNTMFSYWYTVEETSIPEYDYSDASFYKMVRFKYRISGTTNYLEIHCSDNPE